MTDVAVKPHHTVTFARCKGTWWIALEFLLAQMRQLCVCTWPFRMKMGLICPKDYPRPSSIDFHSGKELQHRCFPNYTVPVGQLMKAMSFLRKIIQDSTHYTSDVRVWTARETIGTLTTPYGDWIVASTTPKATSLSRADSTTCRSLPSKCLVCSAVRFFIMSRKAHGVIDPRRKFFNQQNPLIAAQEFSSFL